MQEDRPEEAQTERLMLTAESFTPVQNENEEMKMQRYWGRYLSQRKRNCGACLAILCVELAITQIAERVQEQNVFTRSARSSNGEFGDEFNPAK